MTCHGGILISRDEVEVRGKIVLLAAGPAAGLGGTGGHHGRVDASLRANRQLLSQQLPLDIVLDIRYLLDIYTVQDIYTVHYYLH